MYQTPLVMYKQLKDISGGNMLPDVGKQCVKCFDLVEI